METNFKGTKGDYYSAYNGQYHEVKRKEDHQDNRIQYISTELYNEDGQSLADSKECEANRDLIRDAFNVRQQINVDLPELLEQRNELLEMVKGVLSDIHSGNYPNGEWKVDEIENLITKIEQK